MAGFDAPLQDSALRHRQLEVDPGVELAEVVEDPRYGRERQIVRGTEAQPATQAGPGEVADGLLLRGEDRAGEAGHRLAVGRERHRAGVADEQGSSGGPLQPADVLAHGGLRDPQAGGGLGEAQGPCGREEGAQQFGLIHCDHQ